MSIVIDIKTRVFDEDEKAYRLFPGQGYRHFLTMRDYGVVFLDNPGFPFPGKKGYDKTDKTLLDIAKSESKQWLVQANPDNLEVALRKVDEADYSSSRWSKKREINLGWLNALYHTVKIGDLVIVPSPGIVRGDDGDWFKQKSLIGEIISEPERWRERGPRNVLLGDYIVRRVRWVAEFDERDLEAATVVSLRTQNALIGVRAKAFERILGAAYKNIVIGDELLARFITTDADFTAFENFHFNAFVMAIVAACSEDRRKSIKWSSRQSIYDIAASVESQDALVPDQESSIHSPGYMTLRGAMLIPATMSALFALALSVNADPANDPFKEDGSGIVEVNVINSESKSFDPCEVGIEDSVREALEIMGHDRWLQMCIAAKKANEKAGMQSVATVKSTSKPQ